MPVNKGHVVIIEVHPSSNKPHQFNGQYFIRLDGQTRIAPDYIVRALVNQTEKPNIEGYLRIDNVRNHPEKIYINLTFILMNFSELQNEQEVNVQIHLSNNAYFVNSERISHKHIHYESRTDMYIRPITSNLVFAANAFHSESIAVNKSSLDVNSEITILMAFNGLKSPLKYSEYVLDLNKLESDNTENPNYLISSMRENTLAIDYRKEIGSTKNKTLKLLLGREYNEE